HANVVVLYLGPHGKIHARFDSVWIDEIQSAWVQEISIAAEDQIATGDVHTPGNRRLCGRTADAQVCRTLQAEFATSQIEIARRNDTDIQIQIPRKAADRKSTRLNSSHTVIS